MTKFLATFASVALITLRTFGEETLVPGFAGETVLNRGLSRLRLPHNECDTIAKEVQEQEFRTLLLRIMNLPEGTALKYLVTTQCTVQVSTFGLGIEHAESLMDVLSDYARSRASGHTARYALDALKQRLIQIKPETNLFLATLFETFPHLPRQWVKEDPFPSAAPRLPATNSTRLMLPSRRFVVIDGEIAWVYSIPFGNGRAAEEIKVDAQEFDPKLRPAFDAARNEAEQTLDKRGIKKGFGYVHAFEPEVDAILWQKYQIKRRGFWELNPGIIVD
jgi:hypothetical protein